MNLNIRYCFLILLILLSACQIDNKQKRLVIAFSQCIGNDAWRQTMYEEMKRELSFYPQITFLYRDAQGDNQKQINQIRELSKLDIDLLIVSPNEANPLTPIVDSLFQQNIPIVVTDRKTASGLYHAYVGADNFEIGQIAGDYIHSVLGKNGNIGIITGLPGSSASIEREKGLLNTLRKHPGLRLKQILQGNWEKSYAKDLVSKYQLELSKLDLLLAFNDQMALGARESLRDYPNLKIIGVDALPGEGNGLSQISKGNLFASILYPTGGTESIRTAISILQKRKFQRDNILGTLVIDKTNAKLLELQSQKILQQQDDIDKRQQLIVEQTKIYKDQKTKLNILISSLVISVILFGVSVIALRSNWNKNKYLEVKNKEIIAQRNQIQEMNNKLEEAFEIKNNFFTKISHEFKTPLTLILAPIEDLSQNNKFPAELRSQLQRMDRSAKKLLNLISNLLDFNKISSQKIDLCTSKWQIDTFIKQILNNFKPLFNKKRISMTYQRNTSINEIWIDDFLLEQAISNIISNALKFTPEGGRIQIIVEENEFGDYIHIRIKDNGIGIPSKEIPNLFQSYYQVNPQFDGSGIGLAYAKEIVELHHGSITASSKEGLGTTITLRLAIGDNHLEDTEKRQRNIHQISSSSQKVEMELLEYKEFQTTPSIINNENAYMLIIDDNNEIQALLKEIFKDDYNLLFAMDYVQAQKILNKQFPDIILCDVMLPDGNGLDLLQEIRENPTTFQIPIILLSAINTNETKVEAYRRLVDAYLTKPFNTDYLKEIVRSLLVTRKQLKDKFCLQHTQFDLGVTHNNMEKKFLMNFQGIVDNHISDPKLGANQIANEMNISRIQLYRKIRQLLNVSINEYILEKRLNNAKKLILEGYNINEIFEQLGFSSAAYFAVAFKKKFKITPSALKKQPGDTKENQ